MQLPTLASILLASIAVVNCAPNAYPDSVWVKREALNQLKDRGIATPNPQEVGAVLVAARALSGIIATDVLKARDEVGTVINEGTDGIEGTDGTDQIQLCYFYHHYSNNNY